MFRAVRAARDRSQELSGTDSDKEERQLNMANGVNAFSYLVGTLLDLYITAVMLRCCCNGSGRISTIPSASSWSR